MKERLQKDELLPKGQLLHSQSLKHQAPKNQPPKILRRLLSCNHFHVARALPLTLLI